MEKLGRGMSMTGAVVQMPSPSFACGVFLACAFPGLVELLPVVGDAPRGGGRITRTKGHPLQVSSLNHGLELFLRFEMLQKIEPKICLPGNLLCFY